MRDADLDGLGDARDGAKRAELIEERSLEEAGGVALVVVSDDDVPRCGEVLDLRDTLLIAEERRQVMDIGGRRPRLVNANRELGQLARECGQGAPPSGSTSD